VPREKPETPAELETLTNEEVRGSRRMAQQAKVTVLFNPSQSFTKKPIRRKGRGGVGGFDREGHAAEMV